MARGAKSDPMFLSARQAGILMAFGAPMVLQLACKNIKGDPELEKCNNWVFLRLHCVDYLIQTNIFENGGDASRLWKRDACLTLNLLLPIRSK